MDTLAKFKQDEMDSISESFCAAKWLYHVVWLYNGTTSSCHHPKPHNIKLSEAIKDISKLFNTEEKVYCREIMLRGERPNECDYCWRVEDQGYLSDRVLKSYVHGKSGVARIMQKDLPIFPEILELSFSRSCNLACAYCSPNFSTSWDKYDGSYRSVYSESNSPFTNLFWKNFHEISKHVKAIRLTGGEPLISKDFWKFLTWAEESQTGMFISVNSNLCSSEDLITRLIESQKNIINFDIFTSCESVGLKAEYLRDGMLFDKFLNNCERVLRDTERNLCFMVTANALSVFGLLDFLYKIDTLKKDYPRTNFFINILTHPSFMAIGVLPLSLRIPVSDSLRKWLNCISSSDRYQEYELRSLETLIDMLRSVEELPMEEAKSFKKFFLNYDKVRNKDILTAFPEIRSWYRNITL